MRWSQAAVAEALGLDPGSRDAPAAEYAGVSTDTRALGPGMLFVALRGERFDAHDFLDQAAAAGAAGAVVDRVPDGAPEALRYHVVPDTLVALGRLARHQRRTLGVRVCAITGTNGKTTTKDLARAVLSARYRVHATEANLNNLVGGPLTLLTAPDDAEAVVVEVGTNAPGEIARLRDVVEPDVAIVTTVAEGHLEGLRDEAGVLVEKTSLLERLGDAGIALVGDRPASLPERARSLADRVRVAGTTAAADPDLRAEDVGVDDDGRLRFRWRGDDVALRFRGRHNAVNALLALALGEEWGVERSAALRAISAVEPQKMRNEIKRFGALRVIADCYNSNPSSLRAAVDLLASVPRGGGRIAVLGTMKELGERSGELHRQALEETVGAGVDVVVATGDFVEASRELGMQPGAALVAAEDPLEAFDALAPRLRGDEVVLLKGSRGVALERLIPRFAERFGTEPARAGEGG